MVHRPSSHLVLSLLLLAVPASVAAAPPAAVQTSAIASTARPAIRDQIREQAGIPGTEVFVGEVRLSVPSGIRGPVEIVRVGMDGTIRSGRGIPLSVYVRDDGGETREVRGSVDVSIQSPVVVTARNMPAGAIVSREDVAVRMREYTAGSDGALHAAEEAVGKRARWQLTGGVQVRREYLEDPAAVRRGESVTIVAESGPVRITGKGITLHAAAVGDTVMVRNVSSGREMSGRLSEDRVVRVE